MTAHTVSCRRLWLTYFPKIQSFIKVLEIESPFSVLGGWEFNQTVFGGREGFWEVTSTKEETQEGGTAECVQMLKSTERMDACSWLLSCDVLVCPETLSIGRSSPPDVTLEPPELRAKAMSFPIKLRGLWYSFIHGPKWISIIFSQFP